MDTNPKPEKVIHKAKSAIRKETWIEKRVNFGIHKGKHGFPNGQPFVRRGKFLIGKILGFHRERRNSSRKAPAA